MTSMKHSDRRDEKKIAAVLKKAKKVLVSMHVHPDPDALGAALAMTLYLKAQGKDVRLYNEDACPEWLRFMPKVSLCRQVTGRERFVPDVLLVVDCGDPDRIGNVKGLAGSAAVINVDHHITNSFFGTYNLVHPEYSSTCEILYQFLKNLGASFTREMAILLYLGIQTDTGSFGFDSTTSHTHQVIAELLRFDIPVGELYRKVYETLPKESLKAFLSTMNRLELVCRERVASLAMTRKDMSAFSNGFDFRDKAFGFLRAVKGVDVIVIFTEAGDGRVRVNFRSRSLVDVAAVSARFGGGGHKRASGCYVTGTLAQAQKTVFAELEKRLVKDGCFKAASKGS